MARKKLAILVLLEAEILEHERWKFELILGFLSILGDYKMWDKVIPWKCLA